MENLECGSISFHSIKEMDVMYILLFGLVYLYSYQINEEGLTLTVTHIGTSARYLHAY